MSNDFLPTEYEVPTTANSYMRFKDGENRFRILSKPVLGWLDWKDKKPLRFKMDEKPSRPTDPKQPIKHFWAFPVWDYSDEKVKILEITQATIQSAIKSLAIDKDWGSPFDYDLKVMKKGAMMDTEYNVNPAPKSKITGEMTDALLARPINMEALFTGDDPFSSNGKVNGHDEPPF